MKRDKVVGGRLFTAGALHSWRIRGSQSSERKQSAVVFVSVLSWCVVNHPQISLLKTAITYYFYESVALGWAYSCVCGQLGMWLGTSWSRMALIWMTWLCSMWFRILQQASQGWSHIGDRVPGIETGRGVQLDHFCSSLTTVSYSQPAWVHR